MLEWPLADVLELAGQAFRRHVVALVEDEHRLGVEAPRVWIRLARLARPDLRAILVHLTGHAHDACERLDSGEVEDDLVARLDLLRHVAAELLHPNHPEAVLARGLEVLRRAREDPGLGGHAARLAASLAGSFAA